jgi:glycosyltransferase involved in cell wall biosynthesis
MNPKVSICIPTYNLPDNLRRTLTSAHSQNYKEFEVIISDDSATDNIRNVVMEFSDSLPIRYYRNHPPKGSPANWNYAISLAEGEYIKILHHDDWFATENSLAILVKLLDENPDSDFAFSSSMNCDIDGKFVNHHIPSPADIKRLSADPAVLFEGNIIGGPSATIYRKRNDLIFDVNLAYLVDIDFYIQLLSKNCNFGFAETPLISTLCNSNTQVTSQYVWNRKLEITEYLYLYRKLQQRNNFPTKKQVEVIWNLFTKYDVSSENELYSCIGYHIDDELIKTMLLWQKGRRKLNQIISTFIYQFFILLKRNKLRHPVYRK